MQRWEYCEVVHHGGTVEVNYLVDEGNGHDRGLVQEKRMNNMARVLARLGVEGWEVVDIRAMGEYSGMLRYPHGFTGAESCMSNAFLKRPIPSQDEQTV